MSLDAFGRSFTPVEGYEAAYGHVRISHSFGIPREPSPVAPTSGSGTWELLSGTIKSTIESAFGDVYKGKKMVVEPGFVLGMQRSPEAATDS